MYKVITEGKKKYILWDEVIGEKKNGGYKIRHNKHRLYYSDNLSKYYMVRRINGEPIPFYFDNEALKDAEEEQKKATKY